MTIEGICILILSIAAFANFCLTLHALQTLKTHYGVLQELGKAILNLAVAARTLSEQDIKLLGKIEEHDAEFIRKDEAN